MKIEKIACYTMLMIVLLMVFAFSVSALEIVECVDEDNGDPLVKGSATGYGSTIVYENQIMTTEDVCGYNDDTYVYEKYCMATDELIEEWEALMDEIGWDDPFAENLDVLYNYKEQGIESVVVWRMMYCDEGYACYDGACTLVSEIPSAEEQAEEEEQPVEEEVVEEEDTCSDSDGGADIYEKGTTSGNYGTAGYMNNQDYCIGEDQIVEYYCKHDWQQYKTYDCPSGYVCSDGECIREEVEVTVVTTTTACNVDFINYRIDDMWDFYGQAQDVYDEIYQAWRYYEPRISGERADDIEDDIESLQEYLADSKEKLEHGEGLVEEALGEDDCNSAWDIADSYMNLAKDEMTYVDGLYDDFITKMEYAADASQTTETVSVGAIRVTTTEADEECVGCKTENTCLSVGIRMIDNLSLPVYCDLTGQFLEQKDEGTSCQNDFECLSNSCLSGQCEDLAAQLEETRTMYEKISAWFAGLFGKD